ncbi:MAG: hypothetical protein ACI837_003087, partial [Crocinitomicaceae bacterium]
EHDVRTIMSDKTNGTTFMIPNNVNLVLNFLFNMLMSFDLGTINGIL